MNEERLRLFCSGPKTLSELASSFFINTRRAKTLVDAMAYIRSAGFQMHAVQGAYNPNDKILDQRLDYRIMQNSKGEMYLLQQDSQVAIHFGNYKKEMGKVIPVAQAVLSEKDLATINEMVFPISTQNLSRAAI